MKNNKRRALLSALISILIIFTTLFSTSCVYDPDNAVDLKDSITLETRVTENSTIFYFYYNSTQHPIEDYSIIKVNIHYYLDYQSFMKDKDYFIVVPDNIIYEDRTYFKVEVDDAFTSQSIVYYSVLANFKKTSKTRFWPYFFTVLIALAVLIFLWCVYSAVCERLSSNTLGSSLCWMGCMVTYLIVGLIVFSAWGSGPLGIIIGSAGLFFICTLFTYFNYKL